MTETLTQIEEIIMEKMIEHFGCQKDEALAIITKYLPVIRLLDDQHDGARLQAKRYIDAFHRGVNPDEWVAKIRRIRHIHGIDKDDAQRDIRAQITQSLQHYPQDIVRNVVEELYPSEPKFVKVAVTPQRNASPRYGIQDRIIISPAAILQTRGKAESVAQAIARLGLKEVDIVKVIGSKYPKKKLRGTRGTKNKPFVAYYSGGQSQTEFNNKAPKVPMKRRK